jgi:hypothetical protein
MFLLICSLDSANPSHGPQASCGMIPLIFIISWEIVMDTTLGGTHSMHRSYIGLSENEDASRASIFAILMKELYGDPQKDRTLLLIVIE